MSSKMHCPMSSLSIRKNSIVWLGLLLFMDTYLTITHGSILNHITECCTAGTNYAKRLGHCNDHDYEVTTIPPLWRGLCVSALGVCCSREQVKLHCIAGREAANTGSKCVGDDKYNSASYTDCCKSCQIGLAVAAASNNCSDAITDFFAKDESYTICCNQASSTTETDDEDGTLVLGNDEDICEKFGVGKLCEQICENTKDSYVCKCNPGFRLNENRVTCSKIPLPEEDDSTEDDELDDSFEDDELPTPTACTDGFELNKITGQCADIDECSKGTANCLNHQYCINSPGGFKCVNVKTTTCELGYRFNSKTLDCEDINECLEETDNCKKDEQTCMNTRGGYTCQDKFLQKCAKGFIFLAETGKCEDYDECLDDPCEEDAVCINYPGHYDCQKKQSGYSKDTLGRSHRLSAPRIEKCTSGFRWKHNKCVDIDECLTDKNACDSNQICTNDIGGYHCDCKIGFNMDTTINACVDINECQINNHNCMATQRCDNTIGSYTCARLVSCGTGYTLNAETGNCDDDDECLLNTHTCSADYECRNTKGSFRCDRKRLPTTTTTTTTTPVPTTATTSRAPPTSSNFSQGYPTARRVPVYIYNQDNSPTYVSSQTYSQIQRPVPRYSQNTYASSLPSDVSCGSGFHRNYLGACVDINECQNPSACEPHQRCINTNGSFRCQNLLQCGSGFKSTPNGTACVDIDECLTGEHNCVHNQICKNRSPGFVCSCPPGHKLDTSNRCVDINECEHEKHQVCPTNSNCINTIGSFYCECKTGFQKQHPNEKICIDVDECQEIPGLCQQKCVNFWGGYRCTCNAGYELSSDNRTCNDIDECEVHKSYKLCMGFCVNVPGSYECVCPRGYELAMDKKSCRDVDECETHEYCTGRHDICTNVRGSYRCTTIRCPYGYINDVDQKNRCRMANNMCENDECFNKASTYTYNFITLVSKLPILPEGRVLFTLRGPTWYESIDFDLKLSRIQSAPNIEKATDNHFSITKHDHQVELSLMRSLEGPQDIELELSMTVFMNGQPRGKSIAKIFIIVSQYSF